MKRVAVLACVGVGIWVGASSASTPLHWEPTRLGTLSFPGTYGTDSAALAVNSRGEVLGESGFLSFHATGLAPLQHAFIWRNGRMIDLGTLGGTVTEGAALNDQGAVVGSSVTHGHVSHAFLWRDGKMVDLGTLGGRQSGATAINDRGQIVGWSDTGRPGQSHAFLWRNGKMIDLGTLGGAESQSAAINDKGEVVGSSETDRPGEFHAFVWHDGRMTDLGAPNGLDSSAVAINDGGQVIGSSSDFTREYPFVWSNGKLTLLSTAGLDIGVRAINDRGEILGDEVPARGRGVGRVFVWQHGKRLDLGRGGAWSIDDRGDVVGVTTEPSGLYGRAFFWHDGRVTILGAEPNGGNDLHDSDVSGLVAINRSGTQIAGSLQRRDGHTRAIVWRRK